MITELDTNDNDDCRCCYKLASMMSLMMSTQTTPRERAPAEYSQRWNIPKG